MKLLQLTSSNPKFRTLKFKEGLNIVVGTQLTEDQKKTINGIGKSLSLSLIQYMFGATLKGKLKKYLSEYGEFELSFVHLGKNYIIKKDFSRSEFHINEKKVPGKKYSEELNKIFLKDNSPVSFRQIFNCFARRFGYYGDAIAQQSLSLTDYSQKITNLFLLGVDITLVQKNNEIKEKINDLKNAYKEVKKYAEKLDQIDVNDIKDELAKLTKDLKNFVIAKDYDELKKKADKITEELNNFRNKHYLLENRLKLKEQSINNSENINIDVAKIEDIYREALFFFEEKIKKTLEEAQIFHNTIIENRKNRLKIEIKELNIELVKIRKEIKILSEQRDDILKNLGNSGALEERDNIKDRIKFLEAQKIDLEKYQVMLKDWKNQEVELGVEEALIKKEGNVYLEKQQNKFDVLEQQFRELVKKFYDNHGGSLKIVETKSAKYLFDIDVNVPRDGSQGVGEVKIFCYDILLYLQNPNLLNFIAHDGYIFSEMDNRQRIMIFKIILNLIKEYDLQYFLNIGDNTLNEIRDQQSKSCILEKEEMNYILESKILEITDKDPKEWLFGESFN